MNDVKLKILAIALLLAVWGALALYGATPMDPFVEALKGLLYGVCGYHAGSGNYKGQ